MLPLFALQPYKQLQSCVRVWSSDCSYRSASSCNRDCMSAAVAVMNPAGHLADRGTCALLSSAHCACLSAAILIEELEAERGEGRLDSH
jgi:hypothetical protein